MKKDFFLCVCRKIYSSDTLLRNFVEYEKGISIYLYMSVHLHFLIRIVTCETGMINCERCEFSSDYKVKNLTFTWFPI